MPSRRAIPRSMPVRPLHAHAPPTLSAAVAAADAKSKITRASLMSFKAEPRGMRCATAGTFTNRPSPPFDLRSPVIPQSSRAGTRTARYTRLRPGGFCCRGGCWRRARGVKTRERPPQIQPVRTPRCRMLSTKSLLARCLWRSEVPANPVACAWELMPLVSTVPLRCMRARALTLPRTAGGAPARRAQRRALVFEGHGAVQRRAHRVQTVEAVRRR
jgi:hypothetical protein